MSYLCWFVLLGFTSNPLPAVDNPRSDVDGYRKTVAPLIQNYCADCHQPDEPAAGLSLTNLDPDLLAGDGLETWRMVEEQIRFGDMPPRDAAEMSVAERTQLLKWIRQEILKTQLPGVLTDQKLLLPAFGNYVDHQLLFDRRLPRVQPAPPRIWRLRPEIYDSLVPRLGQQIGGLSNALNSLEGPEFRDFSAVYFLDEASTRQLFDNAKKISENLLSPKSKDKSLQNLVSGDTPPTESLVQSAIETAYRKALGRGPTSEETQRLIRFYRHSYEISDRQTAATAMLTAVLLKPEFMFRQELGDGNPDSYGRVRLTPTELSYALSFALADRPLDEFTEAAQAGQFTTPEEIANAVRQRLQDDSKRQDKNPRILQFFREYFHYPFAAEVFKDMPEGGNHDSRRLIQDLETTICDILSSDKDVLKELLTTRKFYVNAHYKDVKREGVKLVVSHEKRSRYHTAYNLPLDWKWSRDRQPVNFRDDERAGVLTHPAWLAAWSGNFENHPVQRGKWIRTHLLGGTVPDVPIGVDARVPELEHTSFRGRLKIATQATECWRCHRKMDPLGVVFERYDHYGRYQRLDAGQTVDASGEITRTSFPELHQKFSGPTEMMEFLATSERVEQVFVRHVFRYFLGRNETLGDANTLQDAHRAYRDSGGSFRELVVSILSSDSFTLRQLKDSSEKMR